MGRQCRNRGIEVSRSWHYSGSAADRRLAGKGAELRGDQEIGTSRRWSAAGYVGLGSKLEAYYGEM